MVQGPEGREKACINIRRHLPSNLRTGFTQYKKEKTAVNYMKQWQIIIGYSAALIIIGLLLCDDIRTHSDLRACEKAVGLKPDTTLTVNNPPMDSQKPQGVGIHPRKPASNRVNPDTPNLSALEAGDTLQTGRDTSKQAIPGAPGTAGGTPSKIDTFCIEDTTVFPDSEIIRHSLCSPDITPKTRITGLWTFRDRPPDTQKTISKPIIHTRTPWWAHWYVELPAAVLVGYGGYRLGRHLSPTQ